jgi:hypothetical protein
MGTPYKAEHQRFRDNLEKLLRHCGVEPRILGSTFQPITNILVQIRDEMSTCDGAIIVAYEKKYVESGMERRGAEPNIEKRRESPIAGKSYTTPWNHVESALAFSLNLPLYIFCQNDLTQEGLIENSVGWAVRFIDFAPDALSTPEAASAIRDWIDRFVVPHSKQSLLKEQSRIPDKRRRLRLSELSVEQWAGLLAIMGFGFGFGIAAWGGVELLKSFRIL